MSDMMPSWWVGGNPNAGFQANLAQNQAAMANNQNFFSGLQNIGAQNQASLNNAYGPQGFGGATAQAAATGAAYGRATGGFGGGSVFNKGAAPVPYLSGGGMPFGGGGFSGRGGIASPPSMAAQQPFQSYGLPGGGGLGAFSPSPNYPGGRDSIAQSMMPPPMQGQTPTQAQNQPAIDAVNQFAGRGTGVGAFNTPPSQPNQFELAHGAFPSSSGSFADRFAPLMGGNPGTPSQYYTGSQYPGAQAPPRGFQTSFSADNPSGALPVSWGPHQPAGAPMMNAGGDDEPSGDTLSSRDRAIGQGSGGGFYPTPFNPGQFAPSSPFGSGQGVGGRPGGSGGLGAGVGTQMPNTVQPFFGGGGSGFGAPGSTQAGGQYAGSRSPGVLGQTPGFIGSAQDSYGNPFIQGNAPPFAQNAVGLGGGIGLGGLDALGQGTVFRGVR